MCFRLYGELGNTALHLGLWRDGWVLEARDRLAGLGTEEDWAALLRRRLAEAGLVGERCQGALFSASTPARQLLEAAVREVLGVPLRLVGREVPLDATVAYDDPTTIGTDRVLAALGAQRVAGRPCVVLDAGTCMTCDAVGEDGTVLPVAIAPGLPALAKGLEAVTPHLWSALEGVLAGDLEATSAAARSTEQSLQHGLAGALGGTARWLVAHARAVVGKQAALVITGGDGLVVAHLISEPAQVEPRLVLDTLRILNGVVAP